MPNLSTIAAVLGLSAVMLLNLSVLAFLLAHVNTTFRQPDRTARQAAATPLAMPTGS